MVETVDRMSLYNDIDKHYTSPRLKEFYNKFLYIFDELEGIPKRKTLTKAELVDIFEGILLNKNKITKLIDELSKNTKIKEILNILVWENISLDLRKLERTFNTKIIISDQYFSDNIYNNIDKAYLFFHIEHEYKSYQNYEYRISLPKSIRDILKNYLEVPEKYKLKPIEIESIKESYTNKNDENVLKELASYLKYIEHQTINISSSDRVPKTSLRNAKNDCSIKEFYPNEVSKNKDFEFIKTELLLIFLKKLKVKYSDKYLNNLYKIINNYLNSNNFYSYTILFHLKNLKRAMSGREYSDKDIYDSANKDFSNYFVYLVKSLEISKWYSFDNIYNFSKYNDYSFEIITQRDAKSIYITIDKGRYTTGEYITNQELYQELIIKPLLKASFFLFSALGIVDISYKLPKNDFLKIPKSDYISIFDGLENISLSPFGAYVLGVNPDYKIKEIKSDETIIKLSEKDLSIRLSSKNKIKSVLLKNFANEINETLYKVDYSSFMNLCSNTSEIKEKIEFFKKEISKDLPNNWINFFDEILSKSTPLEKKDDFFIYQLDKQQELTHLIFKDFILSKYIMKAEDFHILILKKNLTKVRQRLEELGYLSTII